MALAAAVQLSVQSPQAFDTADTAEDAEDTFAQSLGVSNPWAAAGILAAVIARSSHLS